MSNRDQRASIDHFPASDISSDRSGRTLAADRRAWCCSLPQRAAAGGARSLTSSATCCMRFSTWLSGMLCAVDDIMLHTQMKQARE